MFAEPNWLAYRDLLAIHADQIARYGGAEGIRDRGLLESAVMAPQHVAHYENKTDILMLSLVLCHAIIRNHPFVDGNKRAATVAMLMFIELNGYRLIVPDGNAVAPWLGQRISSMTTADASLPSLYASFVNYLHPLG